jgi:hypothetical protein
MNKTVVREERGAVYEICASRNYSRFWWWKWRFLIGVSSFFDLNRLFRPKDINKY